MTILEILATLFIKPLQLFFEVLFTLANRMIGNPGLSIIVLSLAMNFLVLPLYRRADAMQEEERDIEQKLHDGVAHIKKAFKGDERMMILQTYYRQNHYKPTYVFKGSISLFLEIPFFIAAYQFLSHLEALRGVSFGVIRDLGAADALIQLGGLSINILPIIMTAVNLVSCVIFTKGYPVKTKIQLYGVAIFFLFFLYTSPSGLVFYWTLNNIFSLIKTIFYKLKNPQKVLRILFFCVGVVLFAFAVGFYHTEHMKFRLLVAMLGFVCMVPLLLALLKRVVNFSAKPMKLTSNPKVFWAGAVYLTILVGCVIPSAVIKASPQEFVDINYFMHPAWYICSAFCFACGTFLVWMGVFYWLVKKENKVFFDIGVWLVCGMATVDYMFFGKDLGLLNDNLQFESTFSYSHKQMLVNLAILALVAVVLLILYRYFGKIVPQVLLITSLALAVMSVTNLTGINKSIDELKQAQELSTPVEDPNFTLSKNGKNVVVIMLDRALNECVPYIFNEKPELKEVYSGFTYYSNVASFGATTNFGTPPLFGGYEYTPVEMNKRDEDSLCSKQNEALRVMPVIFDENDYEVTVCDPPYANYQWVPDLSIYDDHPDINTYITRGHFADKEAKESGIAGNKRNFFCYSLMKVAPLCVQTTLYNRGNYNRSTASMSAGAQTLDGNYRATGCTNKFLDVYSVLQNMIPMTKISSGDQNTFMMMSNDTTHNAIMLQEPDYVPAASVDNTPYANDPDRYTVNGVKLNMDTPEQITHYQVNMAAYLRLADWINYLKENDVYDNTRIILVADHGSGRGHLDGMKLPGEDIGLADMEYYYPLLMVKDFNSTGFTTNEEFMTNADVPTLAFQGLIDDPINPATGNAITNDEKYAHDQYVCGTYDWDTSVNNGNQFMPCMWFSIHDDVRDINNWTLLQKSATSPMG